jgi:hypothetical protein
MINVQLDVGAALFDSDPARTALLDGYATRCGHNASVTLNLSPTSPIAAIREVRFRMFDRGP